MMSRKSQKFTTLKIVAVFLCTMIVILNVYMVFSSHSVDGDLALKAIEESQGHHHDLEFKPESKEKKNDPDSVVQSESKQIQEDKVNSESKSLSLENVQDKEVVDSNAVESKANHDSLPTTIKVKENIATTPKQVDTKMKPDDSQEVKNLNKSNSNITQILVTEMVFLDVKIGEEEIGRIEIGLFGKANPNTTANFKGLCEGFKDKDGKFISLKGSKFHRVIKQFMIQGGQIPGGTSIFGGNFPDENFDVHFHGLGWVAMANAGPDTNLTQFFITVTDTWYLNGKTVVFGKVIKGMSVVHKIENVKVSGKGDRPVIDVVVINSGVLPSEPFLTDETDAVN